MVLGEGTETVEAGLRKKHLPPRRGLLAHARKTKNGESRVARGQSEIKDASKYYAKYFLLPNDYSSRIELGVGIFASLLDSGQS